MTLGLPPKFGCLWHVLRLDLRKFCENGTRTDVGPFPPLLPLPLPPSSPPWNSSRAGMIDTVQFTPNQNAPCVICLKWPHALLVRATANYLACHYRRLLIRKKYSQEISLFYKTKKQNILYGCFQ